ncbi:hypothetical protein ACVIWV_002815 [Bradyrhizobium diazoefficiens]|jgi:hypothetical protein|nr:hypothetical protein BD122_20425 [Bradyrhizobium diazoefficiens]
MMLTQAVVTMVLLGHASATWAVPLIAFMSELGAGAGEAIRSQRRQAFSSVPVRRAPLPPLRIVSQATALPGSGEA